MTSALEAYQHYLGSKLDISEHLGLLRGLAMDDAVETIVELGFRTGVSTCALLASGKVVHSFDIRDCKPHATKVREMSKNRLRFKQADTMKLEPMDCDLLFIDTDHTYKQLRHELFTWAPRVSKWIVMHDTETFGDVRPDGKGGLWQAIQEFLSKSPEWRLHLHLPNNNGLTVLSRTACSTRPSPPDTTSSKSDPSPS